MTAPRPREESEALSVMSMVVADLRGLRETTVAGFRDITAEIGKLRDGSVPRGEFEHFRDDLKIDRMAESQRVDRELAEVRARADREEREREARERAEDTARDERQHQAARDRRSEWRWRIGLAVGAAVSLGCAVVGSAHPFH